MLMVNNPLQSGSPQGQRQHPPQQMPPPNWPANSPIRHNQFNQQFQQPPMPQVSPLMVPSQHYNPQPHHIISLITHLPIVHQWTVMNHCLQIDMPERQEKCDQEREEREKWIGM